jgi:hypothetical protein
MYVFAWALSTTGRSAGHEAALAAVGIRVADLGSFSFRAFQRGAQRQSAARLARVESIEWRCRWISTSENHGGNICSLSA